MHSPYVRRRRLAAEIRRLRESRDMSSDELAHHVFQSRTKLSRLENGLLRPDLAEIMNMLDLLGVEGRDYDRIVRLARDAAVKGWWDRYGDSMGPRQRLYADLESGAETIRVYNQTAMPAALQTSDFIEALVDLDKQKGPLTYKPSRMIEARAKRQRHLLESDVTYEVILDECVIHRLAIPAAVMAEQLRHLIETASVASTVIVRVLPHDARIPGGLLPQSSFYLYTFPDPGDPALAVVETVMTDLVHSERRVVADYAEMYVRLREASLPPDASLTFLASLAGRLRQ